MRSGSPRRSTRRPSRWRWRKIAFAMCARVTLTIDDVDEIAGMLDAELSPEDARLYKRRYNVAPSDRHWIVEYGADKRVLVPAKWTVAQ